MFEYMPELTGRSKWWDTITPLKQEFELQANMSRHGDKMLENEPLSCNYKVSFISAMLFCIILYRYFGFNKLYFHSKDCFDLLTRNSCWIEGIFFYNQD